MRFLSTFEPKWHS